MIPGENTGIVTTLFTDIEGSTFLWEQDSERMRIALARHDDLLRHAVESNRGTVVKMIGDGMHAAFDGPLDALTATLDLQHALADPQATNSISLRVRCGLHLGAVERRDNDYFGSAVNRAARIMGAAHGGQVLLSQAVVESIQERPPPGVTFRDLGRVRLRDLASPEHVYQAVHPDLRQDFPSLRSLESTPNNLPQQVTSFVGRERELTEIKRLLPSARLLTLVGIGGIGKTRLALQVAAEVMDAYCDGVWFVDLAPLADADLVPSAVARALGVREAAGTPVLDTLCAQIKGRELLLLLDNCEHLPEACAMLADALLRGASGLALIATSREPLRVGGEQTFPLPTLSLPDSTASAETMSRSEAVQLFIERAAKQQPGFALTTARAAAVAQLCIHLDGIPLALELAAARIRSLSLEEINARLGDRFRLLTSGIRTALPRQQTLRATLDWSHDLLLEEERRVLRRLAIFAGGFAAGAASFVASDHTIDELTVVDLLSQLVSRSLVVADTNDAGARYRLLETTRAYALEKLADADETDTIRRRHAQYYRNRFEHAPDDWLRMSDVDIRANYLPELDNVRAALDWAFGDSGSTAIGIALAGSSAGVWVELSLPVEGRRRLEAAIAQVGSETPDSDQARLWRGLGVLFGTGALPQELAAFERAVALYRRLGDAAELGFSLVRLGNVFTTMGRFEQAAQAFAEVFTVLESADMPRLRAFYYSEFGFLKMVTGDHEAARMHFEKAMSLYRGMGAERDALDQLGNLADVLWTLGDLDAALAGFRETVEMLRKLPMTKKSLLGGHLINLSGVHTERGELEEALTTAREGLPLFNVAAGVVWYLLEHLALRAAMAGSLVNAAHMAGFADMAYVSKKASRQPNEARAHDRLRALLREKLAPAELERLLAEGANMTEDEACRIAVEE